MKTAAHSYWYGTNSLMQLRTGQGRLYVGESVSVAKLIISFTQDKWIN